MIKQQTEFTVNEQALALHRRAIVIDAVAVQVEEPDHWDDWIAGGATVATPTIGTREDSRETLREIAQWYRWIGQNSDRLMHVTRVEDIERAKSDRKLGVLFAFQDTTPVEWNLDLVEVYYRLGVRMIGLCYNQRNRVGDGCGERTDAGLSNFGGAVVRAMNRVGIVVDCSHTGYRTTMDAIEFSTRPPVFSHANALALCDNGRNIRDDQIKAVAVKGGLIGIGAFPAFVSKKPNPSLNDWLDHVDYIAELVGTDHVGIGLDHFSGFGLEMYDWAVREGLWNERDYPPPSETPPWYPYPTGMENATKLPNITAGLLERGYSEEDVLKILGGNWMRVFAANWQ